jgi:hypothetical protein
MSSSAVGLPEALERAASALPDEADSIRPANGDPVRLLELLDADAAVRVLGWLLAHEPEDGAELAEAWVEEPGRGPEAVLRVDEGALGKTGRKLLRRVRHRLRSRGVAVAEPTPAPRVATLPRVEEILDEAMVSPVDPRGSQAVYLVTGHPAGGARLFEMFLDEDRGVLDCHVYATSRGKVRRFLRDFQERQRFAAVPAPPTAVRALARRAVAAQPADRPLPRAFSEWRRQLSDAPEAAPTPGGLVRETLKPAEGEAALQRLCSLVETGELGPWPAAERLRPLGERLEEIAGSPLVVSGVRRREQAETALEESLDDVFAPPLSERTAARLEETAYVWWKQGREDDARACLAAADAFRSGDARANPVARALLDAVVRPMLHRLEEMPEEPASGPPNVTR